MNLRCSRFEVKVHHTQKLQVAKKLNCEARQINFFSQFYSIKFTIMKGTSFMIITIINTKPAAVNIFGGDDNKIFLTITTEADFPFVTVKLVGKSA